MASKIIQKNEGGGDNLNIGKIIINSKAIEYQEGEVETISDLIEYITDNAELVPDDFKNVIPDPENKIYNRFAEYCKVIENEIKDFAMYNNSLNNAIRVIGLDAIKIAILRKYLKQISRVKLLEYNNNPIKALDSLTDYFIEKLKNSGKRFNQTAIRYYLISEIPKCNIFPND